MNTYTYVDCWELLEEIFGVEPHEPWDTPIEQLSPYTQFKKFLFHDIAGQNTLVSIDLVEGQATFDKTGLTFSMGANPEYSLSQRVAYRNEHSDEPYEESAKVLYQWCSVETFNAVMDWAKKNNVQELNVRIWW